MYTTHNNHFQFGWGDGTFNFDNRVGQYWVKFGRSAYLPTSFREECVRAARLLGENATNPLLVCFSGGVDSEVVVRSFQEARVEFTVLIMEISYRGATVNYHDITYALDYVTEHGIPYRTVTIDLEDFLKNKMLHEVVRYKAGKYIGILLHNEMIKQFPQHHCVLGGGDICLERHRYNGRPEKSGLYLEEEIISVALVESALAQGNNISNRFFMHTPELMLAWLLDSDIQHWIKYEAALASKFTNVNYFGMKAFAIYRHWPDMAIRPKYTGLESVWAWHKTHPQDETSKLIAYAETIYETEIIIDYDDLLSQLKPL